MVLQGVPLPRVGQCSHSTGTYRLAVYSKGLFHPHQWGLLSSAVTQTPARALACRQSRISNPDCCCYHRCCPVCYIDCLAAGVIDCAKKTVQWEGLPGLYKVGYKGSIKCVCYARHQIGVWGLGMGEVIPKQKAGVI